MVVLFTNAALVDEYVNGNARIDGGRNEEVYAAK